MIRKIFLLFLIIGSTVKAQEITSDSLKHPKHQIGLNLGPGLAALSGAYQLAPLVGIQYKYRMDKFNLRGGLYYKYASSSLFFGRKERIITFLDSTVMTESYTIQRHIPEIRLGAEWRFGKRKERWTVGGELSLGGLVYDHRTYIREKYYEQDSLGNVTGVEFVNSFESGSNELREIYYFQAGLVGILGVDFPLGEKWSFGMQLQPYFFYRIGIREHTRFTDFSNSNNSFEETLPYNSSSLNFDLGQMLFLLNYKF